jgi:hypothetical protein
LTTLVGDGGCSAKCLKGVLEATVSEDVDRIEIVVEISHEQHRFADFNNLVEGNDGSFGLVDPHGDPLT